MLRRHFTNQTKKDVFVEDPLVIPDEYVDLGLSVQWATCNLGAENPEDPGYFYSTGNIIGHKLLDTGLFEDDYTFSQEEYQNSDGYTKLYEYTHNNSANPPHNRIYCSIDAVYQNAIAHDPDYATAFSPCIPSIKYWQELIDNTTCTYETLNNIEGLRFTASNGNSIFIPIKYTVASEDFLSTEQSIVGGGLTNTFRGFAVADSNQILWLRYTINADSSVTFEFQGDTDNVLNPFGYIGRPIRPVRRNISLNNCQIVRPGFNYIITDTSSVLCFTPILTQKNITITFKSSQVIDKVYIRDNITSTTGDEYPCTNNIISLTNGDLNINTSIYESTYSNTVDCVRYMFFENITDPVIVSVEDWNYPYYFPKGAFLNKTLQISIYDGNAENYMYRIKYDEIENKILKLKLNQNSIVSLYFGNAPIFANSQTSQEVFYNINIRKKITTTFDQDLVNSWKQHVDEYGFIYVRFHNTAKTCRGNFYVTSNT